MAILQNIGYLSDSQVIITEPSGPTLLTQPYSIPRSDKHSVI